MLTLTKPNNNNTKSNEVKKVDSAMPKKHISSNPQMDEILKVPIHAEGSEGSELLALFKRNEIKVGALVGSGSFSEVFEITGFDLKKGKKLKKTIAPARRRKRKELVAEHEKNVKDLYSGKTLKARFVIKQLHQRLMSDPALFRRALKDLATEVKIMGNLEHPHIAQLHATAIGGTEAMIETGKHNGYFIVLDRLVQTLDDRIEAWNQEKIRTGPSYYLDNATNHERMALKANYALQIASALNYLHERRIIYRDLKPQNIGFKEVNRQNPEKDVLALFDFGLSRKLPEPEKANENGLFRMSMVGTRRYMAPELVITKCYDEKVDVYSFALVFYEIVSQTRPYDGLQRDEHKQLVCTLGQRPKTYTYFGLPPELERLMKVAWAQDVSQRASMSQICDTLESYLKGTIHEGLLRNSNRPTISLEDSVSSILSDSTEQTDQSVQTVSTSNSTDGRQTPSGTSLFGATAIEGGTDPLQSTTMPIEEEVGLPRRMSSCERCAGVIRKRVSKVLTKMFR
jgi:serine/threonine protein kinase